MDLVTVRAAVDAQLRREADYDSGVEREDRVTRVLPPGAGWTGVTWSDLAGVDGPAVDAVIAAQVRRFVAAGRAFEWKHYSHDQPADLPDRLRAAGFVPEPPEALLVAEIADLDQRVAPPEGVRLVPVLDEAGMRDFVAVHEAVFGGDYTAFGAALLDQLRRRPDTVIALVALAGDTPIATARLNFHAGTEFASLWGGGTLADWRGRGVFRALVAHRAALAAARGFRYLRVDASPDSEPILRRLGFVALATTTPYVHPGR